MAKNQFNKLHQVLSKIEKHVPDYALKNPSISKASVGWQLDHALKVFNAVSQWTINSKPEDYSWTFNMWRTILFPLSYLPRGKAKAPKKVLPPEIILEDQLISQLKLAQQYLDLLKPLPKTSYFDHHVFGKLNKQQTIQFLNIHTIHHLKIVNDIINA